MQILQINTIAGKGGAAKIAETLNSQLNLKGIKSNLIVDLNYTKNKNIFQFNENKITFFLKVYKFFIYKIAAMFKLNLVYSSKYNILKNLDIYKNSNIIHIHNIHGGYFSIYDLEKIEKDGKKIIWTLHDDWIFSGSDKIKSLSFKGRRKSFFLEKKNIFNKLNIKYIVPAEWLKKDTAQSGIIKEEKIELIYNGIDEKKFKKYDKIKIRKELKLPSDKFIILFIADGGIKNPYKGGEYIEQILKTFDKKNIVFLSIGNRTEEKIGNNLNIGYIQSEELLSKYYSCADVFLYPSLADNCPLVVAEALNSGLPVLSFKTGGIPEIVQNTNNGYIAEYKNINDLNKGLEYIYNNYKKFENVELDKKFYEKNMIENYIKVYNKI